jgi:uncharacterized membrane protein YeaQ/YmgE (transglycosylase-associated protein family)
MLQAQLEEALVDLLQLLTLLAIAGICGAIAQWIVAFSPGSMLVSIIVGVIGAYLGTVIANLLHVPDLIPSFMIGTVPFNILWALIGSILLLLLLKALRNSGRTHIFARR